MKSTLANNSLTDNLYLNQALLPALKHVELHLQDFANSKEFVAKMQLAFGETCDPEAVLNLGNTWQNQDFSNIPAITILSSADLNGANGAYAAATNTIYLSQEFVANHQEDVVTITSVILEEIGHWVDNQINTVDSVGDEGEIFSALVVGTNLSEESLNQLRKEDDSSVLMIDGDEITVEMSEAGNTLATALDIGTISYSLTSPLALPIFKKYNDYVGGDDSDNYFKFTIDKRLGSNINLTAPTNTKLELLNDKGNLITSETSFGDFSSTQIRENLNAGTYYLHLSTTNTTASYYNLDFLITPPDDVSDSYSTAKDLGTLTATPVISSDYAFYYSSPTGSSASFYDNDYYQFTLSQTSTVNFALTDDADSYTSFSIYSSLTNSSVAGLSNQYSETNATLQKTLAAGTYLVSLSGNGAYNSSTFQSAPTAYTLSLSAVPGTIIDPGNTLATALDFGTISYSLTSPLAVPVLKEYDDYVGGDDSDDYFKFTIDKRLGSNISINAPANTKLELLNAQGNLITSEIVSGSFTSTQIRENLDAGTYYLHLSTTNTTASYYNLDFLISPPDNVSDSYSTPKDLGTLTATPVSNSDYVFYYYDSGASFSDDDSYKFTLSQTSTVNFDLTDDAQSYTYLDVYKSPGFSSVANLTNDDAKTSATLQKTLEAGTYTVYLSGNGAYNYSASQSAPTAYTLTLSTVGQPDPSLSIGNVTVTEGDSGTLNATFTVTLTAGNDKVVTVDYGTANGTALAGSDYTTTTGTLTFNVGQVSRTITVPVIGNLSAESVETFVVNLTNPTNATITKSPGIGTINDNDTIDLAVTSATVPQSVTLGSPIEVSWTVTNQGTGTTDKDWNDQIYVSDDQVYDFADTFVAYEDIVEQTPLAGGGSYTITRNITLQNTATGDRYLLFLTDGSGEEVETNGTNNTKAVPINIAGADLQVTAATAPTTAVLGETVELTWTVANKGTGTANSDWYDTVYLSSDQTYNAGDVQVTYELISSQTPLAKDGNYTISKNVVLPRFTSGDQYLLFIADGYGNLSYQEETNETNNTKAVAISLNAPDLIITTASARESVTVGQTFSISWDVKNQGTVTASADWYDRIVVSTDQIFGNNDDTYLTQVWEGELTPLAAAGTYTKTLNVTLPSTATGDRYLLFKADGYDYQDETDESNNVKAVAINISAADLQVTAATAPTTAVLGETVELTWTVANKGTGTATRDWYDRVYLSSDQTLNSADVQVTEEYISTQTPLAKDGSYTISKNVVLPSFATGDQYLLFVSDGYGYQGETNENNNTKAVAINLNASDLVVTNITAPTASLSGQTIDISWIVKNQGPADVEKTWYDSIYLKGTNTNESYFVGNFEYTGGLAAGSSLERTQSYNIPLSFDGDYKVVVTTDSNGNIAEGTENELNNTSTDDQTLKIELSSVPNLKVSSITPPATAFSSQQTIVQWSVTNTGTGATNAPIWSDRVYLSLDQTFDNTDTYLGQAANPSYLNAGDSYTNSLTVNLPRGIDGNYYFLINTDASGQVAEIGNEGDNWGSSSPTKVNLTPPPDLQVTAVNAPIGAFSGQRMNLSWTVTNKGTGRTLETDWRDRVFMSADETLDASDRILADVYHTGGLNADESYTGSGSVTLPIGVAGNYFFFVQSDISNQVYENVFENNNINHDTTATNITLTPPPDLEFESLVIPTNARSGGNLSINYKVTNFGATETPNASWTDTFYLSTDNQLNVATDINLGSAGHYGVLNPDDSYDRTANFTLNNTLTGTYYVFGVTDSSDQVFELNNDNNLFLSANQVQIVSQPADLVITEVTIPTTGKAGKTIPVQWKVKNQGTGDSIVTNWSDRIVASSNNILGDKDDIILATVSHTGLLGANETYSQTENIELPFTLEGDYQLFVVTDSNNNVYESSNEENNSSNAFPVTISRQTPDLQVTAINLPAKAQSGQPITLSWTVKNLGAGSTNSNYNYWYDDVYLSLDTNVGGNDIKLGSFYRAGALDPASSYTGSATFNLPIDINGNYYALVRPDRDNQVIEGALESNNDKASLTTATISLSPVADLIVQSVNAPEKGISGQSLSVTWTVANNGEKTEQTFYDAVYLSRDQVFDRNSDIYLGYRNHTGLINGGESYTATQSFDIPRGLSGSYYTFVVTDSGNTVYERTGETNNTKFDAVSTAIIIPPPSDLVVTNITSPSSGIPGQSINISYTVKNQGTDTALGNWTDSIYLSKDNQWDIGDALLGQVNHLGDIVGGESYTETLNGVIPGVNLENYNVIVRSDIRNQVPEVNESNNAGVSSSQISLDVEALAIGTPDTDNLGDGQSIYYRFDATAGQAIRLKLDSSDNESFNELYVRYGSLPTRGQFDLTTAQPFNADPEIIIPIEQTGTYYILAYGDRVSGTPSYEILAKDIPFSITNVATNTIGNTGESTLEIRGAKFAANTTFQLRAADGSLIESEKVYLENSTLAYVTFDLFSEKTGLYDLQAKQSNGSTTILEDVVTVNDAIGFDLDANITGPDQVRPSRNYAFNVNYGNTGDRDTIAPLLIVESVTKTQSGTTLNGLASGVPLQLLGVSNEGPQGILRPGDQNVLPVYFNSNTDPIEFQVRSYAADDTTLIDWNSLEASIRPNGLTDTQWDGFLSKITPRIQTYGNYVKMLNDMSEQLSTDDKPLYDVRDLFSQMYKANQDYQPTSNLSGQLLDAKTGNPLAGVEIGAYEVRGDNHRLAGKTITDKQGNFTVVSVDSGNYELALGDRNFDMDRDGIVDWQPPSYKIVQNKDSANITIYADGNSGQPAHVNDNNSVLAILNGKTHILWDRDGKLWHSYFDGTNWVNAIELTDTAVSNFKLEASDHLINGSSPGLIATWQAGSGNKSEIYYAIGLPTNAAGFDWSTPIAVTNDSISDTTPTLFVSNSGQVLFTYLKSDQTIQDDTDLYYNQINVTSTSLSQFLSTSEQLSTQAVGINYGFQWNFPPQAKQLPGKIKFQGNLSGQLGLSASRQDVKGSGQIGAQFTFDGPSLRSSINGNGQIEASWILNKKKCDWIFDNATGSWSIGGSFDWKNGLVQLLKLAGPGGYVASVFLDAWLTGLNNNPGGWSIEAGVNVNIGAQFNKLRWTGKEPFPSFLLPDSIGEASLKLGFGPYLQFGYSSDSQLKASGYINSEFDVIPNFRLNKTTGGIKLEITYASGHNWSFDLSTDLITSSSLSTFDSELSALNDFSLSSTNLPEGLKIEFTYQPERLIGTTNVYGNNSVLPNISSDLYADDKSAITQNADGRIVMAWAKTVAANTNQVGGNKVVVSQLNGSQWSTPVEVPNSIGFNDDIAIINDDESQLLLVWSKAESGSITANLTQDQFLAVYHAQDIYYSLYQNGQWLSPIAVDIRAGSDGDIALGKTVDGDVALAWINKNQATNQSTILSTFWNGQSWANTQTILAANDVANLEFSQLGGKTVLFWTQDINSDPAVKETSLFYSAYNENWLTPVLFSPNLPTVQTLGIESNSTSDLSTSETELFTESIVSSLFPIDKKDCECKKGDPKCDKPPKPPYKPPVVVPRDPNDILGPKGFGEDRWIDTDEPFRYTIRFENATTATAPAQEVFITQQLDADLDWRTFRVDDYGWSGAVYELEGNRAFHSTRIDLTATKGFYVDVAATIDTITGIATWRISTIDPTTGEAPLNAQAGFLPTNDKDGAGEGFVSYSVRTKSTVKTGDVIDAKAQIIFDTEEPIDTPPIFNTLDVNKPTSKVNDLPATTTTPEFLVSWAGTDQGSALASYTIYVSDNNGDFTPWLTDTTLTESNYQGTPGHSYKFYAVAMDNAGNTQEIPTAAQATIRVEGGVGAIADFIWLDKNANGIQDTGETGLANVTVKLYDSTNNLIATATTNNTGNYSFSNLTTGDYALEVIAPNSYFFSPQNQGTDDSQDSDVNAITGKTELFAINAGNNQTWDAGLYQLASLTGTTWNDLDGDATKDSNEPILSDWTVYLDSNNNNLLDTGETSTQSDSNGNYSFTNLLPNTYTVAQIVQDGWKQTAPILNITTTASDIPLSIPTLELLSSSDSQVQLNFNVGNYTVKEDGTGITEIWVTRTGNTSNAVSATLSLIDGTAQGCGCAPSSVNNDFNNTAINVVFAANETNKLISVENALLGNANAIRIRNDSKVEGSETFTIKLSNPTGEAIIGNQGVATVTILDDESPTVISPLVNAGTTVSTADNTKAISLIALDQLWQDSRFVNIKGQGYSTVIIDTGIDLDNSLFGADANNDGVADKIVYQYDFANNDNNASDKNNHGSNVASIISFVAPEANLIALKVFKDSGSGSFSDLEKALQWVNQNANKYNIASVNLSLGDSQNWNTSNPRYGIGDELAAIASQNIIIAAAAGNSFYQFNSNPGLAYPAADPNTISVGAIWADNFGTNKSFSGGAIDYTTGSDQIASFSQRSTDQLDVFAPGIFITGANATGGTQSMGGTSQATPFISGIAVLAQEIANEKLDRKLTPGEFRTLLDTTSILINDGDNENDNVTNTGKNFPRVNALALAEGILKLNSQVSSTDSSNSNTNSTNDPLYLPSGSVKLTHTVTLTSGQTATDINFGNQLLNNAPTLGNAIADQNAKQGTAFNLQIPTNTFTDIDAGDVLTYWATLENGNALPSWLTFNSTTQTFSGTPTNDNVGNLNIKAIATDKAGVTVSDIFTITVENVNDAPTLQNAIADQNAKQDNVFNLQIPTNTFTDIDAGDVLTYSTTLENGNALPNWLTFNPTTLTFSGTPTNDNVGNLNVKAIATDKAGATVGDIFVIAVENVNDAPTLANAIPDQNAKQDNVFNFQIPTNTFADIDAGDVLTYSATLENGNTLPTWLTFNSTTQTFSGTPTNDNVGNMNVKVAATDKAGASVNDIFVIAVEKIIDNKPPTVGTPGDDKLIATPGSQFDGQNNIVFTGAGKDEVNLSTVSSLPNSGNNVVDLGSGDDKVFVNKGDRVFGSDGNDTFDARDRQGSNRMSGGAGNDIFFLGSNDRALGGDGNDIFRVGLGGGNLISGGAGADQFWIVNGELPSSANTVLDFQLGTDVIGIQGAVSLGVTTSTLKLNQVGGDTAIVFNNQTLATLTGIQASSLSLTDPKQFVFA